MDSSSSKIIERLRRCGSDRRKIKFHFENLPLESRGAVLDALLDGDESLYLAVEEILMGSEESVQTPQTVSDVSETRTIAENTHVSAPPVDMVSRVNNMINNPNETNIDRELIRSLMYTDYTFNDFYQEFMTNNIVNAKFREDFYFKLIQCVRIISKDGDKSVLVKVRHHTLKRNGDVITTKKFENKKYSTFKQSYEDNKLITYVTVKKVDKRSKTESEEEKPIKEHILSILSNPCFTIEGYDVCPFNALEEDPFCGTPLMNIFTGFQAKLVPSYDLNLIQPILNHIFYCWCDSNEEHYNYQMSTLYSILVNPRDSNRVSPILYGGQGCGKSILFEDFFGPYIFGDLNFCSCPNLDELTKDFNDHVIGKYFIWVNEVMDVNDQITKSAGRHTYEKLKSQITDFKQVKNGKYKLTEFFSNYSWLIAATNHPNPILLPNDDRRFALFTCSNLYKGKRDYFKQLAKSFNQEVANHFFTYLHHYPGPIVPLDNIPMTEMRSNCIQQGRKPLEDFFYKFMRNEYTDISQGDPSKFEFTTDNIKKVVKVYCGRDNKTYYRIHSDFMLKMMISVLNYPKLTKTDIENCIKQHFKEKEIICYRNVREDGRGNRYVDFNVEYVGQRGEIEEFETEDEQGDRVFMERKVDYPWIYAIPF